MIIRKWLKKTWRSGQRGSSLLEAAVALLLLGGAVLTMVMSLSGGALAVQKDDQDVTAQGLARTQMEYIKAYPFNASAETYPSVDAPDGYAVSVDVDSVPDTGENIQKITATVTHSGVAVCTLQDYKVNR